MTREITTDQELMDLARLLNQTIGGKDAASETSWTTEGSLYLIRDTDEVVWVIAANRRKVESAS